MSSSTLKRLTLYRTYPVVSVAPADDPTRYVQSVDFEIAESIRDTESLLDIEDGYCCFRIAPVALVCYEVHEGDPCVSIVDKAAFGECEAAIMVAREADNAQGLEPFHRDVYDLLKYFTVFGAGLRNCEALSAYRGYGITD